MHPSTLGVEELDGVPQPDLGGHRGEQSLCMLGQGPKGPRAENVKVI
jgi:hypothetical protein